MTGSRNLRNRRRLIVMSSQMPQLFRLGKRLPGVFTTILASLICLMWATTHGRSDGAAVQPCFVDAGTTEHEAISNRAIFDVLSLL